MSPFPPIILLCPTHPYLPLSILLLSPQLSLSMGPLFIFLIYYIDYVIIVVPFFSPLYAPLPCTLLPPPVPPLSSCPWVIYISSLASPFPILSLTFPCLFCTYQLCFLIPAPFPPFSPSPLPADNPPCDLYFCDSVPVLVVCLGVFFVCSVFDSCEFVVILLFVFLIFF